MFVFANRFELRCEPKQLILLNYKICPGDLGMVLKFSVTKKPMLSSDNNCIKILLLHYHTLFLRSNSESAGILDASLSFNAMAKRIGFFVSLNTIIAIFFA